MLAVALMASSAVAASPAASAASSGLAVDAQVTTHLSVAAASVTSPAFSTTQPNELLVAFIASDGPKTAGSQSISAVTGGGLTWSLRQRTNAQAGTAEIWTAPAPGVLTNTSVKATHPGSYLGSITVVTFVGADTASVGVVGSANAATGAPTASVVTSRAGSWVWGVGDDWDSARARTIGAGQTKVDEDLATSGDTFWVQRQTTSTASNGTRVTINDTAPTTDRWNLSLIEILPAASSTDSTPPTVQVTSPAAGTTVSGQVAITATASDNVAVSSVQIQLDGVNLGAPITTPPYAVNWNSTSAGNGSHTITAIATDSSGNTGKSSVAVTVGNVSAAAPTVDPSTPAAVAVANNVSSTTSPGFSPPANAVIYAAFSMDSASYNGTITTVASVSSSGQPLTWHLLGRNNNFTTRVGGFLEVWWAYNPASQANITTTATFSIRTKNVAPPVGDFQIIVMDNAAPDQSAAAWNANYLVSGQDNSPNVSVTTTKANSQVFAVFNNWNNAQLPSAGAGQAITSVVLNPTDVDGYWIQKQNAPTASAGTTVTMNATDPGQANAWRGLAWEVLGAP